MVQKKSKKENEKPKVENEPDCGRHVFSSKETRELQSQLLAWYDKNARTLPWRDIARTEVDPNTRGYSVLVSEIMLQQTQVCTLIRWLKIFGYFYKILIG